jgi:replicative DNA helicase
VLIIDYADIMRSSRQYDSLRHELKLIYEELRSFLQEKHIPGWTASQSNREGSGQDVVDLNNMSEAYGKAFVADAVLTLSRRTHEKATGEGRLCVAKNRFGRDGLVYPLLIDTARSKFAVSGNVMSFQKATDDDEKAAKRQIAAKLEELKREQLNVGSKPSGDDAPAPAAE